MSKKFCNTPRGTGRVLTLVSLISAAFGASAQTAPAQNSQVLSPVVVSASRFPNDPAFAPIGATVITADQIREAGVTSVNEAVRKIGGVYGRQNLNGTSDFSLDLRGFGGTSDQNVVVLVDGIRISEYEQTQALMSSIPLESVERIEIVRGGSSVLYGEGATGGTIQIITKRAKAGESRGTVVASLGSHGHHGLNAHVSKGGQNFAVDASVAATNDDNYRQNNQSRQRNFSGGVQWFSGGDRLTARVDLSERNNRFPGDLNFQQYLQTPRLATTPTYFGYSEQNRFTLLGESQRGAFEFAAELSHQQRDYGAFMGSNSDFESKSTQFSPRVRHRGSVGNMSNEMVVGFDFIRAGRVTNRPGGFLPSLENADHDSDAIFVRNESSIDKFRVAIGARHERFKKNAVNPIPGTANYSKEHALNAVELQSSYAISPSVKVFGKAGRSYRVANIDDNAATPITGTALEPQTSRDLEAGIKLGEVERNLTFRAFQHRLKNEIIYDPNAGAFGANANLDPTKRQGLELEIASRIVADFTTTAILQHVSAKFTDGPYAGREVVMVPKNSATVRLNWLPASNQSADVGIQWVSSQRYGGDFDNTCAYRMPSFVTLDARYAKRVGAWEFAVAGTNLTDRNYFTNAWGCADGIYPDAGRQLKFSVRRDF